eukprot:SAG31_NODE_1655_length_7621_cov_3.211912_4_plen_126_part_00
MLQAVRARIGAGANVNEFDVKARDLLTPLHWAAINGHSEITALLIENGAEIEFQNSKGMTPLLLASQNAHPNVVGSFPRCFAAYTQAWGIRIDRDCVVSTIVDFVRRSSHCSSTVQTRGQLRFRR